MFYYNKDRNCWKLEPWCAFRGERPDQMPLTGFINTVHSEL